MARYYREVHRNNVISPEAGYDNYPPSWAASFLARMFYAIGSLIVCILGIRFLLSLLGANPDNGFASFIYNVSDVFARPFYGLFSYSAKFGVSRFEYETLVAIVVYGLLFGLLGRLVSPERDY